MKIDPHRLHSLGILNTGAEKRHSPRQRRKRMVSWKDPEYEWLPSSQLFGSQTQRSKVFKILEEMYFQPMISYLTKQTTTQGLQSGPAGRWAFQKVDLLCMLSQATTGRCAPLKREWTRKGRDGVQGMKEGLRVSPGWQGGKQWMVGACREGSQTSRAAGIDRMPDVNKHRGTRLDGWQNWGHNLWPVLWKLGEHWQRDRETEAGRRRAHWHQGKR